MVVRRKGGKRVVDRNPQDRGPVCRVGVEMKEVTEAGIVRTLTRGG